MSDALSAEDLLAAYGAGYFPMAESRTSDELYWFNPDKRAILPLDEFRVPRSLRKFMRRENPFETRFNTAFRQVICNCAEIPRSHEDGTWINDEMIDRYCDLHEMGHAHSVESWRDGTLVGGLYGVSIGGAFCGESMFSYESEASKVALVMLVERLRAAGYVLLDTQFVNDHLKQFGVVEIPKKRYLTLLQAALNAKDNPSSRFSTISV